MFDLLSQQTELEVLLVNNNGIDEEGAARLAEVLLSQEQTKYKKLHIVNNLLRDGGAQAMSKVRPNIPIF